MGKHGEAFYEPREDEMQGDSDPSLMSTEEVMLLLNEFVECYYVLSVANRLETSSGTSFEVPHTG